MLKLLVVTSCTGEKKYHPENQLIQDDFEDKDRLVQREKELAEYRCAAGEMYTGLQHLRLMEGIRTLRKQFGVDFVNLYVVSAGYGLIPESKPIVPYEVTFNTMNNGAIADWSRQIGIHEALEELIPKYDLVLFLLGDKYLRAIDLPLQTAKKEQKLVFFASGTSRKLIPDDAPYYFVEVGQEDAKSFSYGLVGLKGYLFKLLAQDAAAEDAALFEKIYHDPGCTLSLLEKHRKKQETDWEQITLYPIETEKPAAPKAEKQKGAKKLEIYIPSTEYAKNYTAHMRYFIPEWDDRVDPDYDFLHDSSAPGRNTYFDDVYAHEIYEKPNYDGILVSKVIAEESKKKKEMIEQMGIHEFIRFDKNRPVMGDCGAFDYITQENPPYETDEILDYYERLGFNIGVSIDHLIVGKYAKDPVERMRRYNLTRNNAEEFLRKHKEGNYTFLPSGIAQGWDPQSYRNAVAELIEMGYTHICLGGLVRTTTKDIIEILKEIKPLIPEYLTVHLFGIARPNALEPFCQLGANAMDSASQLRRAWLGGGDNYHGIDGNKYAAIRVPPVDGHGVRVKKMIAKGKGTIEEFRKMEAAALSALRDYDQGLRSIDDTLNAVLTYDRLIGDGREIHAQTYRRVLEDMPWKKCDCVICRSIGIETIIFRGNNRNRRRGFHNTYVFYKKLKEIYPDE